MLIIDQLRKRFGQIKALDGISCSLEQGIYGLLGPNGAGKTTLLRCISGILEPEEGTITTEKTVGYLPQRYSAPKSMKVKSIMDYYAELKEIPSGMKDAAVRQALNDVNFLEMSGRKAGTLSGGMMRRLGIAQAFLGDPEIVLLDEPTVGLDPEERLRFRNMLLRRRGEGKLTILSTHIVSDLESVCDQIILMNRGRIVRFCDKKTLLAEEKAGSLTQAFLSAIEKDDSERSRQRF